MMKILRLPIMEIFRYGILASGAILQGVAMAIFLFPHNIPSGGAAGLAILFHHLFHLSLGWGVWLVNFSLLLLALCSFGFVWTIRTMYSVTITSMTIESLNHAMVIMPHQLFIDLLSGGILFGLGVGLLIKHGASSGGLLIPALLISRKRGRKPGQTMFWINMSVFIVTSLVINWQIVIYAIIAQWISTRVIDLNNT